MVDRAQQVGQDEPRESEPRQTGFDVRNGIGESRRVWLTSREAAAYVGNRSVRAFYVWRKAKGLVPNGRGQFARRDLDRAMAIPRKRHRMSPISLGNLGKRKAG